MVTYEIECSCGLETFYMDHEDFPGKKKLMACLKCQKELEMTDPKLMARQTRVKLGLEERRAIVSFTLDPAVIAMIIDSAEVDFGGNRSRALEALVKAGSEAKYVN